MKKAIFILVFCSAVACLFGQSVAPTKVITRLTVSSEGILMLNDTPLSGSRIRALEFEEIILAQPMQQNLMLLHEDGTGGCFLPPNRLLFMQTPTNNPGGPVWKKITDSYTLGGSIIEASIVNGILNVSCKAFQPNTEHFVVQFVLK